MLSASPFCSTSDDAPAVEMSATEPTSTAQRLARLELMNIALAARLEILEGPGTSEERKEGEAAKAVAAVAVLPKELSEEEKREEHVRRAKQELAEALEEQLRESYYGRVQVSLLYLSRKCARGEPLRPAHVLFVLAKFALVFCLCFLQNIALAVVMDEQVLYAEASDDRFTNGIDDLAHNFYFVYRASLNKIPVPVSALIFLSVFVVALSMLSEVRSVTTLFLAHVDTAEALALPRAAGGSSQSALSTVFWTLSHLIHMLRMGLICSFIVSSSFLIGCSDGPAQILLNSVAMLFILDVDDLLAKALDAPWKSQVGESTTAPRPHTLPSPLSSLAPRGSVGPELLPAREPRARRDGGRAVRPHRRAHRPAQARPFPARRVGDLPVFGHGARALGRAHHAGGPQPRQQQHPAGDPGDGVDLSRRVPPAHRGRRRALHHEPAVRGPAKAFARQGGRVHRVRARDDTRFRVVASRQFLDLVRCARMEGSRELERARVLSERQLDPRH